MMLKVYNSRQKKRLAGELMGEYGVEDSLFDGLDVIGSGDDIWVVSRSCLEQDLEGMKVESMGLQVIRGGKPTIHGIQLLFKSAKKVELTEDEAKAYILGGEIAKNGKITAYKGVPLDYSDGCGDRIRRRTKNKQSLNIV